MLPTSEMLDLVQSSLIADGLASANISVKLGKGNFNENGENWEEADFAGYAKKTVETAWTGGVDAVLDQRQLVLPAPVGGWTFTSNETLSGNQTIYGYRVENEDTGEVLGYKRFPEAVIISNVGEVLTIQEPVRFFISIFALS